METIQLAEKRLEFIVPIQTPPAQRAGHLTIAYIDFDRRKEHALLMLENISQHKTKHFVWYLINQKTLVARQLESSSFDSFLLSSKHRASFAPAKKGGSQLHWKFSKSRRTCRWRNWLLLE